MNGAQEPRAKRRCQQAGHPQHVCVEHLYKPCRTHPLLWRRTRHRSQGPVRSCVRRCREDPRRASGRSRRSSKPLPGRMRASSTHRHYWRKIRYANIPLLHLRHRSAGSTSGCDDLTKSADWRLSPMPELGERVRIFTLTGQTGHGENRLSDNGTRPRTYSTEAMAAPRRKALKTARALITEGGYSLSPCGRSAPGRRRQTDLVQYLRKPG